MNLKMLLNLEWFWCPHCDGEGCISCNDKGIVTIPFRQSQKVPYMQRLKRCNDKEHIIAVLQYL